MALGKQLTSSLSASKEGQVRPPSTPTLTFHRRSTQKPLIPASQCFLRLSYVSSV